MRMDLNAAGRKNNRINNNDDDEEKTQIEEREEEDEDMTDEEEEEKKEDEDEPDFMDNSGKCWEFGSKIVDEKHLKEWCQNKMGGMIVGKEEKLTRQFHCQIKQCQFKAIFLKTCSIIYTRNKHNHPMESASNIRRKKEKKVNPPSSTLEQNYVDHFGKLWPFHAQIGQNISHDKLLTKFGFTRIHKNSKNALNLCCKKTNSTGGQCPFAGIYLKSNGCLYIRGEHEHTQNGKKPQNIGDDYIDKFGKIWKFYNEIGKNIKQEILRTKFGFSSIFTNGRKGKKMYLICRRKKQGITCKFAGIYLKSNGCLYTRGKHNHEEIQQKNPNPNDGDDYVDHLGNTWPFHMKMGKQHIPNGIWHNKFGFSSIYPRQKTVNLHCHKRTTNGGKCPIKGIYVKANGCLYIRGRHEH